MTILSRVLIGIIIVSTLINGPYFVLVQMAEAPLHTKWMVSFWVIFTLWFLVGRFRKGWLL